MTPPPENLELTRAWVAKAEHDFSNAQYVITMPEDECPFDTVCFHAQQAVEKYLKAVLTFEGRGFGRTHDLTELVVLLDQKARYQIDETLLAELNPYAVEARYPGLWDEITHAEAEKCMSIASTIRSIMRSILPSEVL